ncbi:MAG: thioredoxin [Thermodesulfobacteriota bacterium]|nr:thioredoxin [Thermodesulfobacteriota bacterium]
MGDKVLSISDGSFEAEVIQAEMPVFVDFWAPWCGPCKAIGPLVEDLAAAYDGKIKFAKCNVDDNPSTPTRFGIQAIPTLMIFKGGEVVERITGMVPKAKLEAALNKAME